MANPFKPTAGATPPALVGRQAILDEFLESIDDGPGAPGLLQLLAGNRGVGKTVMLTALGNVALSNGWVVIHETADMNVLDRIARQAKLARSELGSPDKAAGSTSWKVKVPTVLEVTHKGEPATTGNRTWFDEVSMLLDTVEPHGSGVCITVDEIHGLPEQPLNELATQMQMFIRADRPIALVMAGLPVAIEDLLAHEHSKPTTFLRRAERPEMGDVPVSDVATAFVQTITESGRSIDDELAQRCAESTNGYPFMIQLVGYHVWRQTRTGPITAEDVNAGVDAARARIGNLVHAPALKDLSDIDRSFLVHMAADDGPSRISDVAARINRSSRYTNVYRHRLIAAGMIHSAGHGLVDFEMPYMREYLREHATHLLTD